MSTNEIQAAEAVTLSPGDTLVLRYDTKTELSKEHAAEIIAQLRRKLHGIEVIIVSADGMAIHRPGGAGEVEIR